MGQVHHNCPILLLPLLSCCHVLHVADRGIHQLSIEPNPLEREASRWRGWDTGLYQQNMAGVIIASHV